MPGRETAAPQDHPAGLRELKKAKTRSAIQRAALRLFQEQGYAATTVEQVAQAAEVSPSTLFRYFPTKEDLVLYDDYDPQLIAALRAQPARLSPIGAVRGAIREVLAEAPAEQQELERQRGRLIYQVPELRARSMSDLGTSVEMLTAVLQERTGLPADDFRVRNIIGAVMGVMMVAWHFAVNDPSGDYLAAADRALAHLEAGLPL